MSVDFGSTSTGGSGGGNSSDGIGIGGLLVTAIGGNIAFVISGSGGVAMGRVRSWLIALCLRSRWQWPSCGDHILLNTPTSLPTTQFATFTFVPIKWEAVWNLYINEHPH